MNLRSPALAGGAVLLTMGLTGCMDRAPKDLRSVSWVTAAGEHLNCRDKVVPVGSASLYDITSDGRAEAFVTMRCVTPGRPQPEPAQLEVFAGDSDPAHPTRLAVLVRTEDDIVLDDCVYVNGARVTVRAADGRTAAMATWAAKNQRLQITPAAALSTMKLPACR